MRVVCLQHAHDEDALFIEHWLTKHGYRSSTIKCYAGDALPKADDLEALIILGGPMNIYEHSAHPWLVPEKALIRAAVAAGRRVLGICLGAQLVADVLGSRVSRHAVAEIGWFPVDLTPQARSASRFTQLPQQFLAFHWHYDTYALPPGATPLASSQACDQQAFSYDHDRVIGLQFHLEATPAGVAQWLAHDGPEAGQPYVQSATDILSDPDRFAAGNRLMAALLGAWLG